MDDTNDAIQLCDDDGLKSALDDRLKLQGGALKTNFDPEVKKVKEEAVKEDSEEVKILPKTEEDA